MTKFWLDLDDPADLAAWLRAHVRGLPDVWKPRADILTSVAEQIEAQVPKPLPPEPLGDCIAADARGTWWDPTNPPGKWTTLDGDCESWEFIARHYGPIRIYRPEPSTEAVEALVREFAEVVQADATTWLDSSAVRNVREFATRVLGGAS